MSKFNKIKGELLSYCQSEMNELAIQYDLSGDFPEKSISKMRELKLLSSLIPEEYGGLGLTINEVGELCETLGMYCSSSALIFAMHQMNVACIVYGNDNEPFLDATLADISKRQLLVCSATSENGVGGNIRNSHCYVSREKRGFVLEKHCPIVSYGKYSDIWLITSKKSEASNSGDQVISVLYAKQIELEQKEKWNSFGFRATCSDSFRVLAKAECQQIMRRPFSQILAEVMQPLSHALWSCVWLGMAKSAFNMTLESVRKRTLSNGGLNTTHMKGAASIDAKVQSMHAHCSYYLSEVSSKIGMVDDSPSANLHNGVNFNNVKVVMSEYLIDIVSMCIKLSGMNAFNRDSEYCLERLLRDSYGAALMINNERLTESNATYLLAISSNRLY
ncbi:acyl-CoA dehydrogenase family protein [Pseudoalteromonas maricaloris]|uniref:acyl-CoA dehydrogenase family protein n=1 Tax=Pseudoalteromonas maricaloris TaxID=184924 RepID=UPI003C227EB7